MRPQPWHSVLFVPGDRPDRISKAVDSGADAVVIDLEDAVSPEGKDEARVTALGCIGDGLPGTVMVRVNSIDSGLIERDIDTLAPVLARVEAILLPKADGPTDVEYLDRLMDSRLEQDGPAVVPIVETAAGVLEARSTASASPRVVTLLFGPADLSAELGVEPTAAGDELAHARSHVVLAAAATGLRAPLDGPHLVLDDADGLITSTRVARALGFGGKVVIHPEQIPVVHQGFRPQESELAWAAQVVAAATAAAENGSGVCRLDDGTFVDEPIIQRARAILGYAPGEVTS